MEILGGPGLAHSECLTQLSLLGLCDSICLIGPGLGSEYVQGSESFSASSSSATLTLKVTICAPRGLRLSLSRAPALFSLEKWAKTVQRSCQTQGQNSGPVSTLAAHEAALCPQWCPQHLTAGPEKGPDHSCWGWEAGKPQLLWGDVAG